MSSLNERLDHAMKKLAVATLGILALAIAAIAVVENRRKEETDQKIAVLVARIDESAARTALVKLGKSAVPALSRWLEDPEASLQQRGRCIETLAAMGPEARAAISTIVQARNGVVRYLDEQYAIGVDATSRMRLAPYYKVVRTTDNALSRIRG